MLTSKITRRQAIGAISCFSQNLRADTLSSSETFEVGNGFNLHYFYKLGKSESFDPLQINFIADHGFKTIRIPFDYRFFVKSTIPLVVNVEALRPLIQLVELAIARGLSVILAVHRAPGYCVNPPAEPYDLWTDPSAQKDYYVLLRFIAKSFAHINSKSLAFNPINEPSGNVSLDSYKLILSLANEAIREFNINRQIFVDGMNWGNTQPSIDAGVNSFWSTRGYSPMAFTHHLAPWTKHSHAKWTPSWPSHDDSKPHNLNSLRYMFNSNWRNAIRSRQKTIVAEWGVFNKTPHASTISFMKDSLSVWDELGWASLLWELRGPFGVIDSKRDDVKYTKQGAFLVDKEMLTLLQSFI